MVIASPPTFSCFLSTNRSGVPPGSSAVGVPHPAKCTTWFARCSPFDPLPRSEYGRRLLPLKSRAAGVAQPSVGDEEDALSDVRGAHARSAYINCPEGVLLSFHVCSYNVEPSEAIRACNLLTKDRYLWTLSVLDEP